MEPEMLSPPKIRAGGGGFGGVRLGDFPDKIEGNCLLRDFYKSIRLDFIFRLGGGLFVQLILHNWIFFLMLQSA